MPEVMVSEETQVDLDGYWLGLPVIQPNQTLVNVFTVDTLEGELQRPPTRCWTGDNGYVAGLRQSSGVLAIRPKSGDSGY